MDSPREKKVKLEGGDVGSTHAQSPLWLGIDLGTTTIKVVLLDQEGNVELESTNIYHAHLESDVGKQGHEQNSPKMFQAVEKMVISGISSMKHRIKGIGITGQMHGIVLWNRDSLKAAALKNLSGFNDDVMSSLYTWQDQRCSPDFLSTLPPPSDPTRPLATGHGCATLFWLSRFRQSYLEEKAFTCCGTIMDALVTCLCGLEHPITSEQLAASLGYFNVHTSQWDPVLLSTEEFPHNLLPLAVKVGTMVGHVRNSLTQWPVGCPVFVAMGDVQCAMLSMLERKHDAVVNIGTSIQLGYVVPRQEAENPRQAPPVTISYFPYFNDCFLALFAGLNGGNAIGFFKEWVESWIRELGLKEPNSGLTFMNYLQQIAENSTKQSSKESEPGLKVCPTFFGERHDTSMTGSISGISTVNFPSLGALFRSTCEGVVDHLHDMVPSQYLSQQGIKRVLVSGSVAGANPFVMERLKALYTSMESGLGVVMCPKDSSGSGSAAGAALFVQKQMNDM